VYDYRALRRPLFGRGVIRQIRRPIALIAGYPCDRTESVVRAFRLKGRALSISLLTTGNAGLFAPLPAALLGLASGGLLLLVSKWAVRLMTPEDPAIGMAKVLLVNGALMSVALGSLAAFYMWNRSSLAWFGIPLALSFLFVASVELLRYGSGSTTRAPRRR
jgi:hypothetical protein